ncbi:MAG: histidine phosphatase family protein [Bacteroidetes bacterium]|nr:histidine phosphatase family protein [Bacteroidota bacterium]
MKIIENLLSYKNPNGLAMIIRHADRDKIPTGTFGNDVLLNEKGISNSLLLGEKLSNFSLAKIYTSPVKRCVQTAEFIMKGKNTPVEIIETSKLGDPGLHITDDNLAGNHFLQVGFHEIYRLFMNGQPVPGITEAQIFKAEMDDFIKTHTHQNGITLFITHDALVAMYDFCLSGRVYTPENWVEYLSGIIIQTNHYGKE